jgi:HD-GYP domain-containing protein (c-di-GMP phosphodiesterase class II)
VICERIKDTCAQTASDPVKLSIALGTSIRTNLNQTYYEIFSRAEDQMYTNKLQERPRFQQDFLYSIQRKLNDGTAEKDQHIERMRRLALAMANKMGLDSAQTRDLETLAAIHDIGKVAIPFEILNKPGRLNENEWEFVQKHTEVGYCMSLALAEYQLAVCILSHHEHWDGSGYPNGLKGESIPLPARIISILDAYDIMTHDTPYKPALTPDQALAELDRCSGSQFDGELVEVFKGILT